MFAKFQITELSYLLLIIEEDIDCWYIVCAFFTSIFQVTHFPIKLLMKKSITEDNLKDYNRLISKSAQFLYLNSAQTISYDMLCLHNTVCTIFRKHEYST